MCLSCATNEVHAKSATVQRAASFRFLHLAEVVIANEAGMAHEGHCD